MKKIFLTKEEVESLKNFCDSNLAVGVVEVTQDRHGELGYTTWVQVKDLPETKTDISDIDSW